MYVDAGKMIQEKSWRWDATGRGEDTVTGYGVPAKYGGGEEVE